MSAPNPNLYRRLTASVPLLVTVIVHLVLIGIAGYFVTEQIIGGKKKFEAPPPTETSDAQKQVEHRLQVARKGGGSAASSSPVSATRIFSTAENALQLPSMPELPTTGSSSLAGIGFGAGMGVTGTGTGYNTGLGSGSGLGTGFMSLSFLGQTTNNVSKIVFIVDVGRDLMDVRKGGFEAFRIIREEIMKLISLLPPSAQFNVVLYERDRWNNNSVVSFDSKLMPATAANKQAFFDWFSPINTDRELKAIGLSAAKGRKVTWKPRDLPNAGIDEELRPPEWARALHFSLEMEPDTVYIVSGSVGRIMKDVSPAELAKRKRENDQYLAELKREGLNLEEVAAARKKAYEKARAELDAINKKQVAQNKPPFVVVDTRRIFDADFQAAVRKAGHQPPKLDTTGWARKDGTPLWWTGYTDDTTAPFSELIMHVSKLKRVLIKNNLTVNYFLFVGPDEQPKQAVDNLSDFTRRNSGKFELLTTKRLQELTAKSDAKK